MREILKDKVVTLGEKKIHYVNEWYESHGTMFYSEGTASISQVDESGKENGLYVSNTYHRTDQSYDENGYTAIGVKKDGKIDGALYGFRNGNLVNVELDGKVIDSENKSFNTYKKIAPNFKESFKLLKDAAKSNTNGKQKISLLDRLKKKMKRDEIFN